MADEFQRLSSKTAWQGRIASARIERWRQLDGQEVEREVLGHPGAVAVVAHDDEHVWLVRQPREAVGDPALLELPAGKLDVEDEPPLETAKRELAEEIGKQAEHWEPLGAFYTSPGFTNEQVHLFLATGISDADEQPEVEENERIDVELRPLADLEALIAEAADSKTIIGLARLQAKLHR